MIFQESVIILSVCLDLISYRHRTKKESVRYFCNSLKFLMHSLQSFQFEFDLRFFFEWMFNLQMIHFIEIERKCWLFFREKSNTTNMSAMSNIQLVFLCIWMLDTFAPVNNDIIERTLSDSIIWVNCRFVFFLFVRFVFNCLSVIFFCFLNLFS